MFDFVLIVDWSASAKPNNSGANSIWIAVADRLGQLRTENPPNRPAAIAWIRHFLAENPHARILAGFDFSFGYPQHTLAALGLARWNDLWELWESLLLLPDGRENDRFAVAAEVNRKLATAGPFWGHPHGRSYKSLSMTKSGVFAYPVTTLTGHILGEWRQTELALRENGASPQSGWKLTGNGSVGSQALLGIAWLQRLRRTEPRITVWPFETGLQEPEASGAQVVLAEVWPSLIDCSQQPGSCKDERQVAALALHLRRVLNPNQAGELFRPMCPGTLLPVVENEEGWVLGVAGRALAQNVR